MKVKIVVLVVMFLGFGCSKKEKGILNGIYVEKHSNGNLFVIGVYNEGKRDGIWSVYKENAILDNQGFYENDSIKFKILPLVPFSVYEDPIGKFEILLPAGFVNEVYEPKGSQEVHLLKTFQDSSFSGACVINIIANNIGQDSIASIIEKGKKSLKEMPNLTIVEEDGNSVLYKVKNNNSTTIILSKIIFNKDLGKYYTLTCSFPISETKRFYPVMKTVSDSFELKKSK